MNLIAFQAAIATTGTAQNLPSNPVSRSITIRAKETNTQPVAIGNSSTVTAATGFLLEPGASVPVELPGGNTDSLWIVGTAADAVSLIGG